MCSYTQQVHGTVKTYIKSYQATSETTKLLAEEGWPTLYYAPERNLVDLTKVHIQHGVNAKAHSASFIPRIAFAIVHGFIDAILLGSLYRPHQRHRAIPSVHEGRMCRRSPQVHVSLCE